MKLLKPLIVLFLLIHMPDQSFGQLGKVPADFCISQKEYKLYQLINQYRNKLSLDPIPLSKSLCYVAKTHATDLSANYPMGKGCNMYSWSDKGDWKPFCYPADQNRKNDVKDKAKEISGYGGKAYELTYWDNTDISLEEVVSFWNSIPYTSAILSNTDKFANVSWTSLGVGIQDGYILLWLGEPEDLEPSTIICETGEKILNKSIPNELVIPAAADASNSGIQHYYIIIGSYNQTADAHAAVKSYKEMGYPNALVVDEQGKIRVAIDHFSAKEKADEALSTYRNKFKGAWVFSK
jgi:hypothetical protein